MGSEPCSQQTDFTEEQVVFPVCTWSEVQPKWMQLKFDPRLLTFSFPVYHPSLSWEHHSEEGNDTFPFQLCKLPDVVFPIFESTLRTSLGIPEPKPYRPSLVKVRTIMMTLLNVQFSHVRHCPVWKSCPVISILSLKKSPAPGLILDKKSTRTWVSLIFRQKLFQRIMISDMRSHFRVLSPPPHSSPLGYTLSSGQ